MIPLSPESDEIRLRDEDSDYDPSGNKYYSIKRIKPKIVNRKNITQKENSIERKVVGNNQRNFRKIEKAHCGQDYISSSRVASEFSSCDFHSIEEFSLEKSNISIRKMNFDNNQVPKYNPKFNNREQRKRQAPKTFEYQPKRVNEPRNRDRGLPKHEIQRRVINIEPQVHESKVSYVFREVSSYEKSIEVPSSFLEPSIVFDEREGKFGPTIRNHVSRYKFNPIFAWQGRRPTLMENKITEGAQIQPKDNDSESLIACSFSDVNLNEPSFSESMLKIENEASEYYETTQVKKEEVKQKKKNLKKYMTQVDQNVDFRDLVKVSGKKKHKRHDSKIKSNTKGHGSTGGAESNTPSEEEILNYDNYAVDAVKGKDFLDPEFVKHQENKNEEGEGENFSDVHKMHMIQTLQGLLFIKSLPEVTQKEIDEKKIYLPPPDEDHKKKVIVFDLDETLVHCLEDFSPLEVDHVLTIEFPNNEIVDAGLNIRPYAIECLKEANKHFQVIVFTASHSCYADAVLDFIDPDRELIQYRMYRDQWVETPQGIYIKDLRMIGNRELKDVLLVDNASYSFGYQLDNGIPIIPFYNDKKDKELLHLMQYLKWVVDSDDVREQNRKAFQLGDLTEQEITEYLNLYSTSEDGEGEGESEEEISQKEEALDQDDQYENVYNNDIMIQNEGVAMNDYSNDSQDPNLEYFNGY